MKEDPIWQDVRRLADELQLQIHLAGMEARDAWSTLEPRVVKLEQALETSGEHVEDAVKHELADVRAALRNLRDDVHSRARGTYARGW
jgi:hypothetical protein